MTEKYFVRHYRYDMAKPTKNQVRQAPAQNFNQALIDVLLRIESRLAAIARNSRPVATPADLKALSDKLDAKSAEWAAAVAANQPPPNPESPAGTP